MSKPWSSAFTFLWFLEYIWIMPAANYFGKYLLFLLPRASSRTFIRLQLSSEGTSPQVLRSMFWQIILIMSLATPTQVISIQESAKVFSSSKCYRSAEPIRKWPPNTFREMFLFSERFAKCTFFYYHISDPSEIAQSQKLTQWLKIVKLLLSQQSAGWLTLIFSLWQACDSIKWVINLLTDDSEQHLPRNLPRPALQSPPIQYISSAPHLLLGAFNCTPYSLNISSS